MRYTETRSESMLTLGHGRAQIQNVEMGGTRDGKVLAFRNVVVADSGAYPAFGGFLPFLTRMMASVSGTSSITISGTVLSPNNAISSG